VSPRDAAALERSIAAATGKPFASRSVAPVGGGCIHTAVRIEGESAGARSAFFAKLNDARHAPMFAAEAEGLAALGETGVLTVPRVVTHGRDDERAWIVMEWLDLSPLDAAGGAALGRSLAALHRRPRGRFGWGTDNFIGASPQVNGWSDDWPQFWGERRLQCQLRLGARNRLPSRLLERGERLACDCAAFFRAYKPIASLLHGDLWGGNAAALAGGRPCVFDPAVYVGDREADIAMTELFGGFPRGMAVAYGTEFPLDHGYTVRRELYNLYHVLNHANLFGGPYVAQAAASVERLLAEIG